MGTPTREAVGLWSKARGAKATEGEGKKSQRVESRKKKRTRRTVDVLDEDNAGGRCEGESLLEDQVSEG